MAATGRRKQQLDSVQYCRGLAQQLKVMMVIKLSHLECVCVCRINILLDPCPLMMIHLMMKGRNTFSIFAML